MSAIFDKPVVASVQIRAGNGEVMFSMSAPELCASKAFAALLLLAEDQLAYDTRKWGTIDLQIKPDGAQSGAAPGEQPG